MTEHSSLMISSLHRELSTSLPFARGRIVACCSDSFISSVRISERRFGRHQHSSNPSFVRMIALFTLEAHTPSHTFYTIYKPATTQKPCATDVTLVFT